MPRDRVKSSSGRSSDLVKDHYRIIVMGGAGVGKSCIISQFLYDEFQSKYKATVEELHREEYIVDGLPLTLDILDTSGSYAFPAMRQLSITNGDAFILVYGVDDEASFQEVMQLRTQILDEKGDRTPIVIVGNKMDLGCERSLPKETVETTVNIDWGHGYVEASAKDNINIIGIFEELLAQANVHVSLTPIVHKRRESAPVFDSKGRVVRRQSTSSKATGCIIS